MNAEQILKSIVKDKSLIKYHRGWGYYIETGFKSLHKIGLIEKGSNLELSLFYGDTQMQSKYFYQSDPHIERLLKTNWKLIGNFHFSSRFRNLIWFDTSLDPERYIQFWKQNLNLLHQHTIKEIPKLINILSENGVIILDRSKQKELEDNVLNERYDLLNICAGFGCVLLINRSTLNDLESKSILFNFLVKRINEGLSIIGENGNSFLVSQYTKGDPPGF